MKKRKAELDGLHEGPLEAFRLALLRQIERDLWGYLITWVETEEDTDRLARISAMLRMTITEQRKILFDHRLRERMVTLP